MIDKNRNPMHLNGVPEKAAQIATEHNREKVKELEEADKKANQANSPTAEGGDGEQQYSLNDDRRVKVLSPGALVYKRFIRNRLAVTGLTALLIMFLFSFVGGIISPYGEKQQFVTYKTINSEFCGATENTEFRFATKNEDVLPKNANAMANRAARNGETSFEYRGKTYQIKESGKDFYAIYYNNELAGLTTVDVLDKVADTVDVTDFDFLYASVNAQFDGEKTFTWQNRTFTLNDAGEVMEGDNEVAYITRFKVKAAYDDIKLSKQWKTELREALLNDEKEFRFVEEDGSESVYSIEYDALHGKYSILQGKPQQIFDTYSPPRKEHWLGTDGHAMDMLTRLMYGGRVSLIIGFIVVFIESFIGVIFGGISGYFGGWVDNLMMRIVDVFYCIPSTPLLIILGAMMDARNVDPQIRMLYLMLILGFLGWPGVARLVRGQILSLREQEFMTATEAGGIRVSRRIFRHLIPNVIPQLIVYMTMGLGSTIIMEATLSFLGLGVRYPFASWGNIISDVQDTHVLTNYLFIWIPAGVCLLVTVLAFNLVGDGLRDAFDPKMKR